MSTYKNRDELRQEARRLRTEEGYGYVTIAKKLNIPSSTARNWTNNIQTSKAKAYRKAVEEIKAGRFPKKKSAVRIRLLEERGNKCECCGREEWNELPIAIEMHRLDDGGDYTRENVLLMCPNCHAQTDTWRRKKQG